MRLWAVNLLKVCRTSGFHGFNIFRGFGSEPTRVLGEPGDCAGVGIERRVLDHALLLAAQSHRSVSTLLQCSVEQCSFEQCYRSDSSEFIIRTSLGEVRSRVLALACGGRSAIGESLGVVRSAVRSPRVGIATHLEGRYRTPAQAVSIILSSGQEVFCTPVSDRRLNVCILVERNYLPNRATRSMLLEQACEQIGFTGTQCDAWQGFGPVGSCSSAVRTPQVLLVGDAAETFDPLGGMGMSHAALSAKLAAAAIVDCLSGHTSPPLRCEAYQHELQRQSNILRGFTRTICATLRTFSSPVMLSIGQSMGIVDSLARIPHSLATEKHRTWHAHLVRKCVESIGALGPHQLAKQRFRPQARP